MTPPCNKSPSYSVLVVREINLCPHDLIGDFPFHNLELKYICIISISQEAAGADMEGALELSPRAVAFG